MRFWRALIAITLVLTVAAWAQDSEVPEGSVAAYAASEGTKRGSFAQDAAIESRDIFTIVRKGKPIGEAMVVKVGNGTCTLLPKGNLKGTPRAGDVLRFVRRAEMPVDGTESWKTSTAEEFSASVPSPMMALAPREGSNSQGTCKALARATSDPSDSTIHLVIIMRYNLRKLEAGHRWVELSFEEAVNSLAASRGATVAWTRKVSGLEYPACDFEMQEKDATTARGRQMRVHTNVYAAIAVSRGKSISARAWKFLNSFKIAPKG